MVSFLISAGWDTLHTMIVCAIVVAPFMAYRRTRHVIVAMVRLTVRKSPRWAKVMIVCANMCPGQIDDVIVFAIVLVPIMRHAHNRRLFARVARYAWHV